MNRNDQRRDGIERALVHHGVDYSPPELSGGRRSWRVLTASGWAEFTPREIDAFCAGLATRENSEWRRGGAPVEHAQPDQCGFRWRESLPGRGALVWRTCLLPRTHDGAHEYEVAS